MPTADSPPQLQLQLQHHARPASWAPERARPPTAEIPPPGRQAPETRRTRLRPSGPHPHPSRPPRAPGPTPRPRYANPQNRQDAFAAHRGRSQRGPTAPHTQTPPAPAPETPGTPAQRRRPGPSPGRSAPGPKTTRGPVQVGRSALPGGAGAGAPADPGHAQALPLSSTRHPSGGATPSPQGPQGSRAAHLGRGAGWRLSGGARRSRTPADPSTPRRSSPPARAAPLPPSGSSRPPPPSWPPTGTGRPCPPSPQPGRQPTTGPPRRAPPARHRPPRRAPDDRPPTGGLSGRRRQPPRLTGA
jgi:hypothetical protein